MLAFPSCDIGLTQFGPTDITCLNNGEWNVDPETSKCLGEYYRASCMVIELQIT